MKKKRKNINNNSGIQINDSIILSLEIKQSNNRALMSSVIAMSGLVALIMSFFSMFPINFNTTAFVMAFVLFSALDVFISVKRGKAFWLIPVMVVIYSYFVYLNIHEIIAGFKFTYNKVYAMTNYTKSDYFIGLKDFDKYECITSFIIAVLFVIAFLTYFFTIAKPNPLPVVLIGFPIIEIGLYYGIELSVIWGSLLIAYWFAVLVIAFSDYGEYDGGKGGFMRKGNLFFPKRNMKFKVTEKCALGVMTGIMTLVLASLLLLRMFGYERSESINEKRWQIKEAVNNFSFEDLAESASSLADAFGFSFDYQNNKLGEKSGVSYKNRDEISLMFSWTDTNEVYSEPLYLKGFVASEYKDNEWFEFDSSVYKNEEIFDKFKKFNTYPQELGYLLYKNSGESVNVEIEELRRKSKSFVPTFVADYGDIQFENDTLAYFKKKSEYTCKIPAYNLSEDLSSLLDAQNITISYSELKDDKYLSKIKELAGDILINVDTVASRTELVNNNELLLAVILENEYRDFVYDNYLDYPADEDFEEIRLKYGSVLRGDTSTVTSKLQTLDNIRNKIHSNTSYTLTPGKTPQNRDFVNYFLFEGQEGYCVHYATAGVMLARMAGIPARYATGYIALDDDFDNYKYYVGGAYEVVLKDNNSHAWAEVYLDGYGWVPYEFTAGYSGSSNEEQQPTSEPATSSTSSSTQTSITTTKTTSSNITKTTTAKQSAKTTTAQTSAFGITSVVNGGKSDGIKIPPVVKEILKTLLVLVLIALFIVLRRMYIISSREKKFKNKNYRKSVADIYSYTLKLLALIEMSPENEAYNSFASEVERRFAGKYFEKGEFKEFTEIMLRSVFADNGANKADTKKTADFAYKLAENIYNASTMPKKLYIKYILVLK